MGFGDAVLALFRGRQDRAAPQHGQIRGTDAEDHHGDAFRNPHRRARACRSGTPFLEEVPLPNFFGTGVVVSIPKKKWEVITAEDLENARPQIREGDIVIVNTGWHRYYGDNRHYYAYAPGFYKDAGEWFVERKVKMVGSDTQALDHPLGTAIGPHGTGAPEWPYPTSQSRI